MKITGNVIKYQKLIAWCFFCLFYVETLSAAYIYSANSLPFGMNYKYQPLKGLGKNSAKMNNPEFSASHFEEIDAGHINVIVTSKKFSRKGIPVSKMAGETNHAVTVLTNEDGPGPSQPEMQSFKSVNADNMVDLFTGDFSYNIPLLDVGGYPIGIHYNSGIKMDEEASWVGLGWNINPGAINRNVRGLPDDFNGIDIVTKEQSIKPNKTVGGSVSKHFELFGSSKIFDFGLGLKVGAFHNNYKGWGIEYGVSPGMSTGLFSAGSLTAGLSVSNNSQTGLDVSPSFGVGLNFKSVSSLGLDFKIGSNYNSRTGISGLQMGLNAKFMAEGIYKEDGETFKGSGSANVGSFPVGGISFVKPSFLPGITMPYTNESFVFSLSPGTYKRFQLKSYGTLSGYTSTNSIEPEDQIQKVPAFGYLNFEKAKKSGDRVLMDFNRDKEVAFRPTTPHIAVPYYTYDLFSIAGEGIGGSFRAYRSDIGFVFDHANKTKSKSGSFGLEVGIGQWAQLGADIDKTSNSTSSGPWKTGSNIVAKQIEFREEDSTMSEPVYFKNPGEFTRSDKSFYDAIGDTDLVSIQLTGIGSSNSSDPILNNQLVKFKNGISSGNVPLSNDTYRKSREKRTQVISYLDAETASKFALDTLIKVYEINAIPSLGCSTNYQTIKRTDDIRQGHHLSEITVLNKEGKRYVYGIPTYNKVQDEVTFAVEKDHADPLTGLVSYSAGQNSRANSAINTDNFYNKESTPPYAQSFLLSSILSSDYQDLTNNGITEDDQGDAIKFNYSRAYGAQNGYYKWRAPFFQGKASYGEGLKSDKRDDRGSYTYGEKEIWYVNSVESKNMIAVFVLETDPSKVRKDMYGVLNENGGADFNQKSYYLKEINLYTKADLIKNGAGVAKPIKTVHFEYDYSLCKNHPASINSQTGKLTLRKIWFSYNKNNKGIQNPYVFQYDKDVVDGNGNVTGNNGPSYNNKSYDRWGNYKDMESNPGAGGNKLSNIDYPYASQNMTEANLNVSAWSLNEIKLPSGGRMKVTYESDNYGYVQDKRAAQMMEVMGFGKSSTDIPSNFLFNRTLAGLNYEVTSDIVFIKVPEAVSSRDMLYRKYLEGIEKVFIKFNMNVKADVWGGGSEMVSCFFDIEDYGIKGNPSDKVIWIKPKKVDNKNAFLLAATQFLRMNLYSKAYPNSEPGDDVTVKAFLSALGSAAGNIKNAIAGFYDYTLLGGRCREVVSDRSFVRLNNPLYQKLGGGHRVKKIEIFDNWNKMTSNAQRESVYGKEYDYTTVIKDETGIELKISSGVASFEPMIGKEENPFTIPSDPYKEQVGAWAPTNYFYVDEPLMESFYPSAMIGYSKVRVRSISKNKKSSGGVQETEFFTTKDFPVYANYTPLIEGVNKYSYQNPKANALSFFNFNVKSYITLSQGFKVELNDMNGKTKATASYAENDLIRPVSYSRNYFRLENDVTAKRLGTKVDLVDSANGTVTKDADMGKEVEIMVDLREQLSVTRNSNRQHNLLIQRISAIPYFLPIYIPLGYNKSEISRYRSAAVTKVVSIHGIMDSMVVVEKGSKVTTKNLVYDGETGEVLLSRTNNEFDDPVYNFSYPAHWAYAGMGPAYKNIQKTLKAQQIINGVLADRTKEKIFESGDEIILTEKEPVKKTSGAVVTLKYVTKSRKIWAIDASKGIEGHGGIYFIDANGEPVSTPNNLFGSLTVVRSGKRNLLAAGVGAITAMINPVKFVNNQYKIVIDSNSKVINVNAVRYKELWKIDSTVSLVDTCYKKIDSSSTYLHLNQALLVKQKNYRGILENFRSVYKPTNLAAMMHHIERGGGKKGYQNGLNFKTAMEFDLSPIPEGATITSASLNIESMPFRDTTEGLTMPVTWIYNNGVAPLNTDNRKSHYNFGGDNGNENGINFTRLLNSWNSKTPFSDLISAPATDVSSVNLGSTPNASCADITGLEIKNLLQSMSDSRETSFGILMSMNNYNVNGGTRQTERRSRSYYSAFTNVNNVNNDCATKGGEPYILVKYKFVKDTCHLTCKPSVRPEGMNPYKFGILGNWKVDRGYTYYNDRKENDATTITDIRENGSIKSFMPYWSFGGNYLTNTNADTIGRWVWNSEITQVNRKGAELENKDPLDRYNSVQYGYNKNLPIAVSQNSKSRNMVFDGFEDYDYKTSYCETECESYNCLPPVYNPKFNNCDTLKNVADSFLKSFNIPTPSIGRNAVGCDTTTWNFPQSQVGGGSYYSWQSVFYEGVVGPPDSSILGAGSNQFQMRYLRPICNPTNMQTTETRFKLFKLQNGASPSVLIFLVNWVKDGLPTLMDLRIGQGLVNGSVSGVQRPDLKYDFSTRYNNLKFVQFIDTISIYVNDTLLGKVGPHIAGAKLSQPYTVMTMQFSRCVPKVDWFKVFDGNGRVMLDEQFNDCANLALPMPDFNCLPKADCAMAFANYFNNRFKTSFSSAQIGTLYKQCSIYTSPCGDSLTSCENYDTVVTRTSGYDRFADFTKGGGKRISTEKHTGKYSMSVAAQKTSSNIFPTIQPSADNMSPVISIKIDTILQNGVYTVTPKGKGLLTRYNVYLAKKKKWIFSNGINPCMDRNIDPAAPLWNSNSEYSNVNKDWGLGSPQQFSPVQYCASDYFGAEWTGKLQAEFNVKYVFRMLKGDADDMLMYLDGSPVLFRQKNGEWVTDSITLQSCRLYDFKLTYRHGTGYAQCKLLWSNSINDEPTIIPASNFYKPNFTASDTAGSCNSITKIVKLNTVKPTGIYNPYFSPVAGTKAVISAWVKESIPCNTGSYILSGIDVNFGNSSDYYKLRPTGNIIEGWQRIEGVITIPANSTSINVGLRSLGNATVYFDDIRIFPFNATMKSFVYNPSNLRLMSELDENNYASFYEYDDDGTLIRVKKETIDGIKTIQETRSALYKE